MKTQTFYADSNRSGNLLHIETDGCVVNIHVGLTDVDGRQITRVDVNADGANRGGDGNGQIWVANGRVGDDGASVLVVRQEDER